MTKKIGVALAGGGARGAYQIAVLKVLKEHGYLDNVYAVSGASVGSLNAVVLATDDLDKAKDIWLSMDQDSLFKAENSTVLKRLFKEKFNFIYKGVYQTDKLETMIDDMLDYKKLKDKHVYVATSEVGDDNSSFMELITLNLRNFFGKKDLIRYQSLSDMDYDHVKRTLLASCAIPVVFKPVVIDNKTYYDGGVLDNLPIQPLIDAGCNEIIAIDLFRFNFHRKDTIKDIPITHIYPRKNLRGIMDFRSEQLKRRYELGEIDALNVIETLKQKTLVKEESQ